MNTIEIINYEKYLWEKNIDLIAGVDEVGRGALAGPMVVCALILNTKHLKEYNNFSNELRGYLYVNDSKMLTPLRRRIVNEFLQNVAISYSIIEISNQMIDEKGISYCTNHAFYEAISQLKIKPQHVLTDSFEITKLDQGSQTNIISGDKKSITIAAASIVAKVYRDNLMVNFNQVKKYEIYRFDKHKGYGTQLHRDIIKKHGYSDLHRKTFKIK